VLPLAVAFVGYVVLWNVSLQLNSVGFYQLMKIMTLPAVVLLELVMLRKRQTPLQLAAVVTVCLGVGLATVADTQARAAPPPPAVTLR
jgi:solute carrier family 35 protein E3